jgi:manganese/zinc/iron transport system permease protein
MEILYDFFSFRDSNVRTVVAGTILIGLSSGLVGCFAFLRKRALQGDTIAHSVLPGVVIAFMLSGSRNPLVLLIGALISGFLSVWISEYISRVSKIKPDTATALVLSVFFGTGILLLTSIQNEGGGGSAGLQQLLFGKAAALTSEDLVLFGSLTFILIVVISLGYRYFRIVSFSPEYAAVTGIPVRLVTSVLNTLTVLTIALGIQAVGVVLMAALLLTPAATARYWTDSLRVMLLLSSFLGIFSGLAGSFVSYLAPSMPTGPWIVVTISFLAIFSFYFSPNRGIISRWLLTVRTRQRMLNENILKAMYKLEESSKTKVHSIFEIIRDTGLDEKSVRKGVNRMIIKGLLKKNGNGIYEFTLNGRHYGQRITKLHRLWELYLTSQLRIRTDYVHDDAEAIEHFITPELEKELEALLNYPEKDPHNRVIPYRNE